VEKFHDDEKLRGVWVKKKEKRKKKSNSGIYLQH
jgi:hypothetical protein